MYFTYVVRPGELPLGRSPQCRPLWDSLMSMNLRLGTFLQLLSFCIITIVGVLSARGITFKRITTDSYFNNGLFTSSFVLGSLLHLIGAVLINGFRNVGDDESSIKYTRGYRTGVKFLSIASLLDCLQAGLTVLYFLSWLSFFDDEWQTGIISDNPMQTYVMLSRFLHFAALLMYGGAFFYMETYHNVGTAEIWGWSIATLFIFAGGIEILNILMGFFVFDLMFTISYGIGLLSVCIWAQTFEPIINFHEVKLDQSALRNEWFKSKNAMAYYGPPIEEGIELVKK